MEYIRTLTREFDAGEHPDLLVENRSGSVAVVGQDTQRVRVEVIARLWVESDEEADEQANLIAGGISQEGTQVVVIAPHLPRGTGFLIFFGRGPRIDYQITVPRATQGRLTNRTGRIEAVNLAAPLTVDCRTGRIAVTNIDADTKIVSRSGLVRAETITGSLELESRTGSVNVRGCEGDVTIISRTGSIQIEDVSGGLKIETRTGAIRYRGDVRGPFDISVRTGSVRLDLDSGSTFFLDAETVTGTVHSDLPLRRDDKDEPSSPQDGHMVRIRARTGSIRIGPRS